MIQRRWWVALGAASLLLACEPTEITGETRNTTVAAAKVDEVSATTESEADDSSGSGAASGSDGSASGSDDSSSGSDSAGSGSDDSSSGSGSDDSSSGSGSDDSSSGSGSDDSSSGSGSDDSSSGSGSDDSSSGSGSDDSSSGSGSGSDDSSSGSDDSSSGSGSDSSSGSGSDFTPTEGSHSVTFLHHSTGGNIWAGGVEAAYKALRPNDTIREQSYPTAAYGDWENKPQTYQHLWTDMADSNGRTKSGQDSFDDLLGQADVIVLKHCFDSDAMTPNDGNPFSQTLARYKAAYEALKTKFKQHPNTTFIVWTVAPLTPSEREHFQASGSDRIQISLDFRTWVLTQWDEQGDNIFVFDYRRLATRGTLDYLAESDSHNPDPAAHDSHPSATFSKRIAPCFARRMADVINGEGDTTDRLGGCDPYNLPSVD